MSDFQLFIDAIKNGSDEEIIEKFKIEFLEMTDKDLWRPLHHASLHGRVGLVKLLLSNHCEIDSPTIEGYRPIHLACKNGHVEIVDILIENKCDINVLDNAGQQSIHLACNNGHLVVMRTLMGNNCNLQAVGKKQKEELPVVVSPEEHQQSNNIVNNAATIEQIVREMDLHCQIGCDHQFCRKSLEDGTFNEGEFVGEGGFGDAYKYKISNTNREIVIKQTKYDNEDTKYIEGNINKYLYRIIHRNIVRYFGALEKSGKLCIFMEYMPGGSLQRLIDRSGSIKHSEVISFSKQILEGLQFIHSQKIIHRDIKPENILFDHDQTLKLTDFGLSRSLRISILDKTVKAETFCGTPNYMAPEVFLGELYNYPADIWSTGATIIHMITGKRPCHWLESNAVMFKIGTAKKIEFTPRQRISGTMKSFIDDLLTPEQSRRPSAESLLNHSIFNYV